MRARTGHVLVALGAALVLGGLAAAGASHRAEEPADAPGPIPPGALAVVDGVAVPDGEPLLQADGERDAGARAEALVEEELLIAHALSLGLARSDPWVRARLLELVVEMEGGAPGSITDAEVEQACLRHPAWTRGPRRRRVEHVVVRVERGSADRAVARARAEQVRGAWMRGEAPPATLWADDQRLSDVWTVRSLRGRYFGTVARAAFEGPVGDISLPVDSPMGVHVLKPLEELEGEPQPCARVRDEVRARLEAQRREGASRALLERLRGAADIRRAAP